MSCKDLMSIWHRLNHLTDRVVQMSIESNAIAKELLDLQREIKYSLDQILGEKVA